MRLTNFIMSIYISALSKKYLCLTRVIVLFMSCLIIFPVSAYAARHNKNTFGSARQSMMDMLAHELYSKSFDNAYCNEHPSVSLDYGLFPLKKVP